MLKERYIQKQNLIEILKCVREKSYKIKQLLNIINPNEKTIVFCATQYHCVVMIRDLINQHSVNPPIDYCVRVTAEDGARGDTFLRQFQDNENVMICTILTTSQKLSTGVDALNIRNIVLLRPINSKWTIGIQTNYWKRNKALRR